MKRILLAIIAILLFVGCEDIGLTSVSKLTSSPDSRFMGEWVASDYGEYLVSIHDFSSYSYNSDKYQEYYSPFIFTKEGKIENDQFVERLWDNKYDDWGYSTFTFTDSTHLTMSYYLSGALITENYTKQ
jgi:hypothetical protein